MRVIQVSDCHLFADQSKCGYGGVGPYASLQRVLAQVCAEKPDFVMVTGDISGDDSAQSYAHFTQLMLQYLPHTPYRVIAGNHDNNPHFSLLNAVTLHPQASWLTDRWCLHGLDTRFEKGQGRIEQSQLDLLSQALRQHRDKHHILFLHHHPVAANSWMDKHCLTHATLLERWLSDSEGVSAVFHGHVHYPLARQLAGCPVYGVPSTCWQFAMTDDFLIDTGKPGYRLITLGENGDISTEVRRVA